MKIKLVVIVALLFSLMSCKNEEFTVEDFGSTSVFFPFQRPVRTLILGKYDLGNNDNDNNARFEIGVVMSGVYENKTNRKVFFQIAPDLLDPNILGVSSVNVKVLPPSYYTLLQPSPAIIPAGAINGRIGIQLNDAFFDDPLSFGEFGTVNYVIPVRITGFEEIDSLLVGVPVIDNAKKIQDEDWKVLPKDYTLFGIKFINKYDAKYLRRGVDVMTNQSNQVTTTPYKADYVERDEVVDLKTSGRSKVKYVNRVRRGTLTSPGDVIMELVFNATNSCTISSFGTDPHNVNGSGRLVDNGDELGGKKQDVVYLDYTYTDPINNESHAVKDTLVVRNRDVKFEQFTLQLTP